MAKKDYNESDIQVLSDADHIRIRTAMYLGNTAPMEYTIPIFADGKFHTGKITFVPAVLKCIGEIIDNCIDEHTQNETPAPWISIDAHPILGTYTIADNGRGVPIGKHETGKHTPEVVFGSLRSGRNFSDSRDVGVIGMNGIGSSAVCAVSTEFSIDIRRDNKQYLQTFTEGSSKVTEPSIKTRRSNDTGTAITFQLDDAVFPEITLPELLVNNRAMEIALTNPGMAVKYNGTKYKFSRGFEDIIKDISTNYFRFNFMNLEFFVVFDVHEGIDEQIFSWVNSSLLYDGGICNTQFQNAFYDKVATHLEKEAKKNKVEVTKNDIRQNLLIIGNLKVANPEYDAQSKTRLTGPNLRKDIVDLLAMQWNSFARKNKQWLDDVLSRAISRHRSTANKNAIKQLQKKQTARIPGLIDATSKDRSKCRLLVTEGDSAAAKITQVRDPKTVASLPLRGKVNNVYGTTVAQLIKMGKVADLITAIGLIPGQKAVRSELRYSKVVIASDADYDGDDIFTLLCNLFYQFWPELFDPNQPAFIHRLEAPNVVAYKAKKRIHFSSMNDYAKAKDKYAGWSIVYFKGLGSMIKEDWRMIIDNDDALVPITDDGNLVETFQLLFSDDADKRKEWLQSDEQ